MGIQSSIKLSKLIIGQIEWKQIAYKNNLTIARGEGEETVGRGIFRNYYKGHMDKTKGEGGGGGGR